MKPLRCGVRGLLLVSLCLSFSLFFTSQAFADSDPESGPPISTENWGRVTAPVAGSTESGIYAGAELFAGPNKFGSYFSGVLPNGTKATPAGTVAQIGINPLGAVLKPEGKYII